MIAKTTGERPRDACLVPTIAGQCIMARMNWDNLAWYLAAFSALTALGLAIAIAVIRAMEKRRTGDMQNASYGGELLIQISRQLEALDRIGERVEGLDRAFRVPRVRGGFGETLLEELLRSWLPAGSWSAQYSFPDGSRADAVIRMGSRLVAVDAKFPLERLGSWLENDESGISAEARRTFLQHAGDIAARYVRPADGTLSFALMYLPAEALHYRLLHDDDGSVARECLRLGVLPVGPMGLFAYLQTVAYGLRGLTLPAEGAELRQRVDRLRRDFDSLAKPLSVASTHLKNLTKTWEDIDRKMGRVEGSLENLDAGTEGPTINSSR